MVGRKEENIIREVTFKKGDWRAEKDMNGQKGKKENARKKKGEKSDWAGGGWKNERELEKREKKDYRWIDSVLKMKIKRWKMNGKSVRKGRKGKRRVKKDESRRKGLRWKKCICEEYCRNDEGGV
jgi:hypothetical protein